MIDTPGLLDSFTVERLKTVPLTSGTRHAKKQIWKEVYRIFALAPTGFDAILHVVKYGSRFTDECRQALRLLINFLGSRSKEYLILILTYGDQAKLDAEDENIGVEECIWRWIRTLPHWVQDYINDISGRVVLFDNRLREDKDPVGFKKQLTHLIEVNSVLYLRGFVMNLSDMFQISAF